MDLTQKEKIKEELKDLEEEVSDAKFSVDVDSNNVETAKKQLHDSEIAWAESILKLEAFKEKNNIIKI